jgi:hypothetical protein
MVGLAHAGVLQLPSPRRGAGQGLGSEPAPQLRVTASLVLRWLMASASATLGLAGTALADRSAPETFDAGTL